MIGQTPPPPYYAVIFSVVRANADNEQYTSMAEKLVGLMMQNDGFLGLEFSPDSAKVSVSPCVTGGMKLPFCAGRNRPTTW